MTIDIEWNYLQIEISDHPMIIFNTMIDLIFGKEIIVS